jgi:hypothetical protein
MKMNLKALSILALGSTIWLFAFAANRKVTIPADTTGIKLFNGWTSSVNYSATCYDTAGATAFTTDSTIAAKQSVNLVSTTTGTCLNSGGVLDPSTFTNGMGGCPSLYTDYATSMTSCPATYQPCTVAEYNTNRNSVTTDAFLADMPATWSYSTDGVGYTNNSTGKPRASYNATELCATGPSGSGTVYPYCTSTEYTAYDAGPLCCRINGLASSCTVEITTPGGHLQSPQFKGNTPF